MGLVDVSVPIVLNNQYLGSIMTGQVLIEKEHLNELEQIMQPTLDIEKFPELKSMYENIPIIPKHKVEAATKLLYVMANYIVEKSMTALIQQQLNEKNAQLMEEMKVRTELEKALKEAELKVIQSQINPHFLLNTLNAISRLALFENATKTQEVVISLAKLLRAAMLKMGGLATLKEEIMYIENYLLIVKARFGDRIQTDLQIDDTCLDTEIPLFTLQPLVENAVIHGIEPKEEGGRIVIKVWREGNMVHIQIEDNGLGMPLEVLEEILQLRSKHFKSNHLTGLGMASVYKRLQYYFGSEFYWNVKSRFNEGTQITIILPYRPQRGE